MLNPVTISNFAATAYIKTVSQDATLLACYPFSEDGEDKSKYGGYTFSGTTTAYSKWTGKKSLASTSTGYRLNINTAPTTWTIQMDVCIPTARDIWPFYAGADNVDRAQIYYSYDTIALGANANLNIVRIAGIDRLWHNVAATFDGSTYRLYVDGTLKGSGSGSNATNFNLYINGKYPGGYMNNFRLYSRALSTGSTIDVPTQPLTGFEIV